MGLGCSTMELSRLLRPVRQLVQNWVQRAIGYSTNHFWEVSGRRIRVTEVREQVGGWGCVDSWPFAAYCLLLTVACATNRQGSSWPRAKLTAVASKPRRQFALASLLLLRIPDSRLQPSKPTNKSHSHPRLGTDYDIDIIPDPSGCHATHFRQPRLSHSRFSPTVIAFLLPAQATVPFVSRCRRESDLYKRSTAYMPSSQKSSRWSTG